MTMILTGWGWGELSPLTVASTAQTGLVYKNFLLLYNYVQVQASLQPCISVQAQITIKMTYKNCKLACRFTKL